MDFSFQQKLLPSPEPPFGQNRDYDTNVDKTMAGIINKYHPGLETEKLKTAEKFFFNAKLMAKTGSPSLAKAKGIYPIPFVRWKQMMLLGDAWPKSKLHAQAECFWTALRYRHPFL